MAIGKNVRVAAREAMQRHGYDPLDQLIMFAQCDKTSLDDKKHIAEVLLPYMYPKLSNVTIEGEVNTSASQESQARLLRQMLSDPELADAAQRLSIAAANAALESEMAESTGRIQ